MIFYHLPIYLQSPLIKSPLHNDCFEVILQRDIFLKDDCSRKKYLEKKDNFLRNEFLLFYSLEAVLKAHYWL